MIVENYEPKTKGQLEEKKRVIYILNKIRLDLLDCYLDPKIFVELHKNFECDRIDSILNKYFKKNGGAIDEIIDQIEIIGDKNKTQLEETIAVRVKLRRQKAEH